MRGLTEVGCIVHTLRYSFKALDSDEQRMGTALHLIARLYSIEDRAKSLTGEERLELRQGLSAPVMAELHKYLLEICDEVLPKSPEAKALRYALNQWAALSRFLEDGDLEIDNGATERASRDIALGRAIGRFSVATVAARPPPCCSALLPCASGTRWNRSPGSAMCSYALPPIRCTACLNCSRITGSPSPPAHA